MTENSRFLIVWADSIRFGMKRPPDGAEHTRSLLSPCVPLGWLLLMALGLLGTAGVAIWFGVQDVSYHVSLGSELFGLVYLLAGLACLAGFVCLVSIAKPLLGKVPVPWPGSEDEPPPTWQVASVFGGAVVGCYVDVTIVLYSLGYRIIVTWVFIALALICFFLACVMLRIIVSVRKYITKSLKGLTISAALVGLVAQFWYLSIYAPENTPVGLNYTFTIGPVVRSGNDRLVQVNLNMEDAGSVPALALGSIIVVKGISLYPKKTSTILRVLQPYRNASFMFPGSNVSYDFLINVNRPGIDALNFQLALDFARTTWLTLGQQRGESTEYVQGCRRLPSDVQTEWYIVESPLRSFAQGPKVVYSDYCEYPREPANPAEPRVVPFINVGIASIRGQQLVPIPDQSTVRSDLGILYSYRNETLVLG